MITTLLDQIAGLPAELQQAARHIFYIDITKGAAIPPPAMEAWVERQFGAVADVREQTIVKVTNRLTLESALFNPLRARRPSESGGGDAALEAWIERELAARDMFREPERDTTADLFGRIRGRFCITASNVAKYDGWHGLVIFDEPHPLRFGQEQLADYLDVTLRWIAAAHAHDPQAIYPIITWNCLPKSGATLMHGHMQIALARGMHYAQVERWRRAAALYRATSSATYYDDLYALHRGLGLAIACPHGVRAFVHLTPQRNREVVLFADSPPLPLSPSPPLAEALHVVLRGLIDRQGMRAFNLAIALPPIGPAPEDWGAMPIVTRLADRGDPMSNRSDLGAMELFASGCVTADPFVVAQSLSAGDEGKGEGVKG